MQIDQHRITASDLPSKLAASLDSLPPVDGSVPAVALGHLGLAEVLKDSPPELAITTTKLGNVAFEIKCANPTKKRGLKKVDARRQGVAFFVNSGGYKPKIGDKRVKLINDYS